MARPTSEGARAGTIYGRDVRDKPVVGDWDNDHRDEPGIYRAGTWHLGNLAGTSTATIKTFTYGLATDVPLAGDWDGDGRDGVGVRRGTRFYLRNLLSAGPSAYSPVWGLAGDRPVVGDWNGDKRDSPGLVRDAG